MPLIPGCTFENPSGARLPGPPIAKQAPSLAPIQGDHLFGDVLGAIGTSLQMIFGGGAIWLTRMQNYYPTMVNLWDDLRRLDFGHATNAQLLVRRQGQTEQDQHAHVFGGFSNRMQWQFCEIVCEGFQEGREVRRIGGFTPNWKNAVLGSLEDLLNHLVDSTAIASYIANPNATRDANKDVKHPPMSLADAGEYVKTHNGLGQPRVRQVLNNYAVLCMSVSTFIDRFNGPIKTLQPLGNTWT